MILLYISLNIASCDSLVRRPIHAKNAIFLRDSAVESSFARGRAAFGPKKLTKYTLLSEEVFHNISVATTTRNRIPTVVSQEKPINKDA